MRTVRTARDTRDFRALKIHPATTRDVLSGRVPPRTIQNIHRGHIVRGIRDIARIGLSPWEEEMAKALRLVESERLDRANRFYHALQRIQALLGFTRQYSEELQASNEELNATNEELQATNEELEAATENLERVNAQLEAFSSSVSHDLRAPLRALHGFSRILLEEHAAGLSPDAQRYLRLIHDNAKQMGQLVDALLQFSRVSREQLKVQPVAPDDLVRQAIEELRAEQEGRRVEIALGDLPTCQADPGLLKQVFINLLSNALKFTRKREAARIEVGCRPEGNDHLFFVKDNGVGFDMRYAEKLFGVFQRLHKPEDYEGTGVGLAIVEGVIQRHGGRVWAEAEVDNGATFYFTLPRGAPNGPAIHGNPAGRG